MDHYVMTEHTVIPPKPVYFGCPSLLKGQNSRYNPATLKRLGAVRCATSDIRRGAPR
jgi:hypothetical protein